MIQDKAQLNKALRAALLIYPLLTGILGTAMFGTLIFWVVPKDDLPIVMKPLSFAAIFLYGTCILAIWFRTKLPKQ